MKKTPLMVGFIKGRLMRSCEINEEEDAEYTRNVLFPGYLILP